MADLALRLALILGFLAYMAGVYLVLHIIFARFIRAPASRTLWFFAVVTRPLTRPIRAFFPRETSDVRIRWLALGMYAAFWLVTKILVAQLRTVPPG
jgi:hypothetical protein